MSIYREKSASVAKLMPALAKAMAEFQPIAKDGSGTVIRDGRKVKYRYASLESLHRSTKPALLKHGVVPTQEYCLSDEGTTLVTTLNYGDEFISSTLPIRQYEDQQRLKAHKSYMRRTAYEAILCLSAEDDSDGSDEHLPEGDAAAAAPVNGVPAGKLWAQQLMLAKQAIAKAETSASLDDILSRVKKKIDDHDMDPHSLGPVEEAIFARRMSFLSKQKQEVPA
jgi:hypothetical protein